MKPGRIKELVGSLPFMTLKKARIFYDLITVHQLCAVLELGFLHGVSTAYLAGAVEDVGGGTVTTIDLTTAKARKPNIEELLAKCSLSNLVEIFYEPRSFNWRLMKFLEQEPPRSFDLIYMDAAHTWVDTGFGFCLARMLLRPGGWIVFDDLTFTYRTSKSPDKEWVRKLPEDEQTTAQVERVFSLLTMEDRDFDTFRVKGNLGFARKRPHSMPASESSHNVERQVALATERAQQDAAFRKRLLTFPDRTLAELSGQDISTFSNVRFEESPRLSPCEPKLGENGSVTHILEKLAMTR